MTLHEVSILRTEGRCVFLDHIYIGGKSEVRRWSPENYMETGNGEVPRDKETRYYKDRTVGGGGGRA